MLEKSINKNQKSQIHSKYSTAKFNQAKYGGVIHTITRYEEKTTSYIDPLDVGIVDIEPVIKTEYKKQENSYLF